MHRTWSQRCPLIAGLNVEFLKFKMVKALSVLENFNINGNFGSYFFFKSNGLI